MATVTVQFGGKGGAAYDLQTNEDLVAVRTWDRQPDNQKGHRPKTTPQLITPMSVATLSSNIATGRSEDGPR